MGCDADHPFGFVLGSSTVVDHTKSAKVDVFNGLSLINGNFQRRKTIEGKLSQKYYCLMNFQVGNLSESWRYPKTCFWYFHLILIIFWLIANWSRRAWVSYIPWKRKRTWSWMVYTPILGIDDVFLFVSRRVRIVLLITNRFSEISYSAL
jgi:uncharacterized membrane protein HdeD (DUF308 family)